MYAQERPESGPTGLVERCQEQTQSSFVLSSEDEPSLRALEHQLKRDAGRCSRIRDFQLFVGDRRDDPTLIRCSDEIWNRTRLDVEVSRLRAFVQRISPGVGNHARRNGHGFLRRRT